MVNYILSDSGQVCNVIIIFLKIAFLCGCTHNFLKYEPRLTSGLRGSEHSLFFLKA